MTSGKMWTARALLYSQDAFPLLQGKFKRVWRNINASVILLVVPANPLEQRVRPLNEGIRLSDVDGLLGKPQPTMHQLGLVGFTPLKLHDFRFGEVNGTVRVLRAGVDLGRSPQHCVNQAKLCSRANT